MFYNNIIFFYSTLIFINLATSIVCSPFAKKIDASNNSVMQQTDDSFEEFKRHLNLYFSHLDRAAEREKNNAYGRLLLKDKENLKEAIKYTNANFLDLRQKLRDIVFLKYGNHPDTNSEAIAVEAELTAWYITYMKALLHSEVCQKDETR